jgi:hypothetical protein
MGKEEATPMAMAAALKRLKQADIVERMARKSLL